MKKGVRRIAFVLLVAALAAGGLIYHAIVVRSAVVGSKPAFEVMAIVPSVRSAAVRTGGRAVYPYSVIRGGVRSGEEVEAAMARDPVVAEHYAGFASSRARKVTAEGRMKMYASFRMGDSVYWTRAPVRLAAGELLLTDGVSLVRARCGNRLSLTRRAPTGPDVELDTPVEYGQAADGGDAPDVAWLPLVVHEIFPGASLLPQAVSEGGAGGFGWMAGGGAAISGGGTCTMGPAGGSDDGGPVDDPRRPPSVSPPLRNGSSGGFGTRTSTGIAAGRGGTGLEAGRGHGPPMVVFGSGSLILEREGGSAPGSGDGGGGSGSLSGDVFHGTQGGGGSSAAAKGGGQNGIGTPEPEAVLLVAGGALWMVLRRRGHEKSQRARSRLWRK